MRDKYSLFASLLVFVSAFAQEPLSTPIVPPQPTEPPAGAAQKTEVSPHAQGTVRDADAWSPAKTKDFVRAILGDTEEVWSAIFGALDLGAYPRPTMVLVTQWGMSACGRIQVSSGPFYCARDSRIYLDPSFMSEVGKRFGDFAAAYLIAYEVGHHVQSVLSRKQQRDASNAPPQEAASTRAHLDVQADCYAGVWTFFVQKRGLLDPGDLDQLPGALSVGDSQNQGEYKARRLRSFERGLATGNLKSCDL